MYMLPAAVQYMPLEHGTEMLVVKAKLKLKYPGTDRTVLCQDGAVSGA